MNLAQMLLMARPLKSYQQVILADHPVAYWPLNETSGTVAQDLSGHGNNMAYQNAPTLGAASIAPGLGKSVSLNGSNQFVELVSPPSLLQIVEGSFEGWWNVAAIPTAAGQGGAILTTKYQSNPVNYMIGFNANSGATPYGGMMFGEFTGSAWQQANRASAISINTAYHVVGTFNGSTCSLYINGALIGTQSGTLFTPSASPILIGAGDNAGYTTGLISNVAMYSTILTPQQILNHYNAGIA